jgi:hypothetical protein
MLAETRETRMNFAFFRRHRNFVFLTVWITVAGLTGLPSLDILTRKYKVSDLDNFRELKGLSHKMDLAFDDTHGQF